MHRIVGVTIIALLSLQVFAGEADLAITTESAKKAADYLLKQQNPDGTFGKKNAPVTGVVGLALKALASSPDKYRESNPQIAKAVEYLLSKKQPNGAVAIKDMGYENYNTSVVAIALAALENPAHKKALEQMKKYILSCQLDEEEGYKPEEHTRGFGSFGYGNSKRGDVSNTAFSMEALKALGLEENSEAWKNAILFLKRSQDNDETNDVPEMKGGDNTGGFVYLPGDSEFGTITTRSGKKLPKPYGNMTYQAVKSLIYAGMKMDDPAMQAAFKWIKTNYSAKENPGGTSTQGYFYYAVAFAKAFSAANIKELELADGRKANWAKDLATHLISLQNPDGSFVNTADRWWESDPILATSYALDALNLCIEAMKK